MRTAATCGLVIAAGAVGVTAAFTATSNPAPLSVPSSVVASADASGGHAVMMPMPAAPAPALAVVGPGGGTEQQSQLAAWRAAGAALAANPAVNTLEPADKIAMRDGYWDPRVMGFVAAYATQHRLLVGKPMTMMDGVETDPRLILLCTVDRRDAQRDPIPEQLQAWLGTQPTANAPASMTVVPDGIILRWS